MNKKFRIKKSEDIENIINNKHFMSNKYYVVYKKENNEATHFHLAISVSKKYGNAVMRNYAKRQLRSIVRESVDIHDTNDIFIIIRIGSKNIEYQEKKKALQKLLLKLNIKIKEK